MPSAKANEPNRPVKQELFLRSKVATWRLFARLLSNRVSNTSVLPKHALQRTCQRHSHYIVPANKFDDQRLNDFLNQFSENMEPTGRSATCADTVLWCIDRDGRAAAGWCADPSRP